MKKNFLFGLLTSVLLFWGCTDTKSITQSYDGPIFDIALQAINPVWFNRAIDGVDYGLHSMEKYESMVSDTATLFRETLAHMEAHNIQIGLLVDGTNRDVLLAKNPDLFHLAFTPNLRLEDHSEALIDFEEGILEGKYIALGELGLVYQGIPLNTEILFPYYEIAQKHGIPMLIHTGFSGPNPQKAVSPAFRIATADPLLLEDVIINFPDLNIVMMHMAWPFFDEALYMLGTYPNVYIDTSVAAWLMGDHLFHRLLEETVATVGSEKVLYGSLQMAFPGVIGDAVNSINEADYLTLEDKESIFWGNAIQLFGIEE